MTEKLTDFDVANDEDIEQEITQYLLDHSEFFERHPELLAGLRLSHPESGEAVSLIERQVQALRSQKQHASQQLHDLVCIARENDSVAQRLHSFALAMIDAQDLNQVLDTARDMLIVDFALDAVELRWRPRLDGRSIDHDIYGDADFANKLDQAFAASVQSPKPLCGLQYPELMTQVLAASKALKSWSLIPLGGVPVEGVLVLAQQDAERFTPNMGTAYLAKLGELVSHGIKRYLD
ncbi:MAG: DUF484 family protein [Gammaproteobacteria bacterium]|nr:MAG: DUF484 family protein [Gammaproteobacteria bacterium]